MIAELGLLILAIPVGFLIAWIARDELRGGRRCFQGIVIAALALATWFALRREQAITLSSLFIAIVALISYVQSYDARWTRRR